MGFWNRIVGFFKANEWDDEFLTAQKLEELNEWCDCGNQKESNKPVCEECV